MPSITLHASERRMPVHRLRIALIFVLAIALAWITLPAFAQTKSLEWRRLDTDITVLPNGDLQIEETNVIDFTNGTFSFGYRDIDQSRLTGVNNIVVTENGQPLETEIVTTDDGKLRIKYYFLTPAENEERTFVLRYLISGATRYYEGGDQVFWSAVYPDRNGFPVLGARSTVRLPAGATADNAEVYGVEADVRGLGESVVVGEALAPIPSGDQMEIRVQFPHGIITGSAPPWQQEFDARREFEETEKPRFDLATLLISALVFIGGPALAVVLYTRRGRDPEVGLVAEYLTEPPNVAPGVAGVLVDETADMRDVLATLVDLARRGVLTMKEKPKQALGGALTVNDWVFAPGDKFGSVTLRPFEKDLVDALRLSSGEKELSSLKNKFFQNLPKLKDSLYDELVTQGYYNRSPETTRGSYSGLAMFIAVLAGMSFCGASVFLSDLTSYALCIPLGLGATAVAFFIIARQMPARTRAGAEMRMRAEAFKRYLQNIEKYTNLQESKDQFEKYLPFAVAFGLEHSFTGKFAAVDTPTPPWYVPAWPRPYYGPSYRPGPVILAGGAAAAGRAARGDIGGAATQGGGIEGMEQSLARGIGSLEGGLSSMFDSVATTFNSRPAPSNPSSGGWSSGRSGGGFSGGGFSGGGSSGGGGGGFG